LALMAQVLGEVALREWLVDHLVINIGAAHDDIDADASFWDMGVGSRDAVVLSGELADLLGRPVSPVEFWQHPTINVLVEYLTAPESKTHADIADSADRRWVDEPVAVIGLGCRFPGEIRGPEALWQFLCEGWSAVGEVPPDRWAPFDNGSPEAAAALSGTTRWGSFLTEIDSFDADFFEISPREAAKMDPQQRLLLEVTHEALEHAGLPADSLRRTQTGVFAGACGAEYGYLATTDLSQVDAWSATGGALSVIANRISYFFDLRGPSVTVDTACSSSLVAVHLACQSLRTGDSNLAIAAGVNLLLSPIITRSFDQAEAMSPTGRCRAFDAGADGFVRGEGAGVVVLKRLADALRDGDRVLAVVRGSAVNQDGRSNGLMAPNPAAQMAVLRTAYANAGVDPRAVDYIEAHGTGTLLGDPIEARALGTVLGRGRPDNSPLLIGSVKSNLGHLEAAAGIAGFIKAVLSVHRGHIPMNLNFENPNPHIPFESLHLKVVAEPTAWPSTEHPRRAGVSSFGFGGTNAHVVLEQGPDPVVVVGGSVPVVSTLVVSGKSAQRVASMAGVLAEWMDGDGAAVGLAEVAHALNHHRARQSKFATVCARDRGQAVAGLRALAGGYPAPGVVGPHEGSCGSGTVFVYSGQGSQWAGMGRRLLADEPAFAAAVAELEPVFVEQVGFSLQRVLAGGEPVVGIDRVQPVLVGVQLALTALWRSYGVQPDAVIGHSMGEVSAAVVAGALTPAQGLKVIATRSRLMARLAGQGAMALLEVDAAGAEALIVDYPGVSVAVYASPCQTVVAGSPEQVDALIAVVDGQGRLARRVEVDVASHHRTVDSILPELGVALGDVVPSVPVIPVFSTVGDVSGGVVFDAGYWVANLRRPVRFAEAVAAAGVEHAVFVEVSPHPLLIHAIGETLAGVHHHGLATLQRDTDDTVTFHSQLAALGTRSTETARCAEGADHVVDIPPTPWAHTRHWLASRPDSVPAGTHPLLGVHVEMPSGCGHVWQAEVGTDLIPWLADHKVHGQTIMPAAGFAEMALAAGCQALSLPVEAVTVDRFEVEQMLPLDGRTRVTTHLMRTTDDRIRVEIHSRSAGGSWIRHAVAGVDVSQREAPVDGPGSTGAAGTAVSPGDFYTALRRTGAYHGPAFAALTRIVRTPTGSSEVEIALPDEATPHHGYHLHPIMLDAALQGLAAAMPAEALGESAEATYLPVAMDTIRVFGRVGRRARCRAELVSVGGGADKLGRITLTDDAGTPTAEFTGVYLRRMQRRTVPLPLAQKVFGTEWVDVSTSSRVGLVTAAQSAGSWLVLADDAQTKALADEFAVKFGSPTRRVIGADMSDESAVLEAFTQAAEQPDLPPVGVVAFVGQRLFDGTDAGGALARARDSIWEVSATTRAVVGGWHGESPRLWLITRDGLVVHDGETGDPAVGGLKGLIRVLAYEHPDLRATLVDVDPAADVVATVMTELDSPGNDDVIAWRGQHRYAQRLSRTKLPQPEGNSAIRADGSYIVTGGLGGVGLVVARWLVDGGAGRVVLNGRSLPSEVARIDLAELERNAEVVYVQGDIAQPDVAEQLVGAAEATGRPLRGVVHSAAVLDDGLLATLSRKSLERVWAPKAAGALRLHEATAARKLDWWVAFSSVASLLGSPGQAAYAGANAWLDGLVAWRRAAGLPATAINWGQWSDVGLARSLTMSVLDPISPAEGIEALETLVGGGLTQVGVARLRLDRAAAAFPEICELSYFSELVDELAAFSEGGDWAGPEALRELDRGEAERLVVERLRRRISAIMGYSDDSAIDPNQPLIELGIDSLMAVRIRNTARGDFGVEPPVALLLQGASLRDLAAELINQLGLAGQDAADQGGGLRDRTQRRVAARQRATARRKAGQRA